MKKQPRAQHWISAAERFGKMLERDPLLPGEYRDVCELDDSVKDIANGIFLKKLANVVSIDIAAGCLASLAQYHQDLGKRRYDKTCEVARIAMEATDSGALQRMQTGNETEDIQVILNQIAEVGEGQGVSLLDYLEKKTERTYDSFTSELLSLLTSRDKKSSETSKSPNAKGTAGCVLLVLLPSLFAFTLV